MNGNQEQHNNELNEDEYHLPDTESQNVYGQPGVAQADSSRRRKILIAIGLIVVVLSAYKLFGLIFGSRTSPTTSTTTVTKTTMKEPAIVTKPEPVITPTKPMPEFQPQPQPQPQFQSQPPPQTANLEQKVTALVEAHEASSHVPITKMENDIANLTSSLADIQNKLSQLNQRLDQMQQDQVKSKTVVKAIPVRKVVTVVRVKPVIRINYFVQAILPGRAWLGTSDGETLTVTKGSILPGFGKVSLIDPVRGVVVTNKGAIIRYKDE